MSKVITLAGVFLGYFMLIFIQWFLAIIFIWPNNIDWILGVSIGLQTIVTCIGTPMLLKHKLSLKEAFGFGLCAWVVPVVFLLKKIAEKGD